MAERAVELSCETVQIFSRSPRGGKAKDFSSSDISGMNAIFQRHNIYPLVVHVPYFLNLASSDETKRRYSAEVLLEDLKRTEALGGKYLVTHIGHKDKNEPPDSDRAVNTVLLTLGEVLKEYKGPVKLLLENTAGQGQEIGTTFETIAHLIRELSDPRVGACFDTCHAFGQGYDLSNSANLDLVLSLFNKTIGLDKLWVIHLNDSKGALGSHVDRHEHIGKGQIGLEGFRALINSSLLPPDIPGILETPSDYESADRDNITLVKSLRK